MPPRPHRAAPQTFTDAEAALAHVTTIYSTGIAHLRQTLHDFVAGHTPVARVRACYPFVRVRTHTVARADSRLSFGFVALLVWAVVGISMGAILLLLYLLRRGQVARAASLIYLVPPLAAIEAAIAFGEELTLPMIAGTFVVVAGVYLANRRAVSSVAAN